MADPNDPVARFLDWFREANERGEPLPERVCLATSTTTGAPSARMVLYKGIDRGRFLVFTDYRSRKAAELEANPRAALVFHWLTLERQVRVEGTVHRLEGDASDRYHRSRRRGSQISAWTSHQSREIADPATLANRWSEMQSRFRGGAVPRPPHWGGYAITPETMEFWIGRENRLHERTSFRRFGSGWSMARLQP